MKRFLKLILISCVFLGIIVVVVLICDTIVRKNSIGKTYNEVENLPYNHVGLMLGTGKYLADGQVNYYYQFRIDAAAKLMKSQKIKYLIISGDNSRKGYDEPTDMRQDLINAGIDSTRIFLDYAGFSTFDSMVRAREIFGQESLTIVSQPFHNERAIYIAGREHISAIGFNARDVGGAAGFKVQLREKLARVKVLQITSFLLNRNFSDLRLSFQPVNW